MPLGVQVKGGECLPSLIRIHSAAFGNEQFALVREPVLLSLLKPLSMVFSFETVTLDELVYSRSSWIGNTSQISRVERACSGLREGSFQGYLVQSHNKR